MEKNEKILEKKMQDMVKKDMGEVDVHRWVET